MRECIIQFGYQLVCRHCGKGRGQRIKQSWCYSRRNRTTGRAGRYRWDRLTAELLLGHFPFQSPGTHFSSAPASHTWSIHMGAIPITPALTPSPATSASLSTLLGGSCCKSTPSPVGQVAPIVRTMFAPPSTYSSLCFVFNRDVHYNTVHMPTFPLLF